MNAKKQIALVTGASSGIGEAIARELAARGWIVIGIARSSDKLQRLKEELQDSFVPMVCDVSQKEHIENTSSKILESSLIPSLFFLNAAMTTGAVESPERFDLEKHEKSMQVNYFGVLGWVAFWEKICQANGGAKFVATSSLNARFAPPCASAYSASKAAIAKAFESLSLTYFGTGLKFCVVYPGPVETQALSRPLPFTWKPAKMGKCMVDFALGNRSSYAPFWLYNIVAWILQRLPAQYVLLFLNMVFS